MFPICSGGFVYESICEIDETQYNDANMRMKNGFGWNWLVDVANCLATGEDKERLRQEKIRGG